MYHARNCPHVREHSLTLQLLGNYLVQFCRSQLPSDFRIQLLDCHEALTLLKADLTSGAAAAGLLMPLETDTTVLGKWLHALQGG